MRKESIMQKKSFAFAVKIIGLYKFLTSTKKEFVISRQILKSGTSIGANIEEATGAQSTKDFLSKISIAYKEARETSYWLKLLHATDYISVEDFNDYFEDSQELCKILGKTQITIKKKMKES